MKLGKKKASEESVAVQPEAAQVKPGKPGSKSKATGSKRFTSIATQQALVVLIAAIVAVVAMQFLVLQPAQNERQQEFSALALEHARARLEQQVETLQQFTNGLASQARVLDAVGEPGEVAALTEDLKQLLPGIQDVYLFAYGDIPRSTMNGGLGFASLDLARRTETGRPAHPDAFPRDGQWYIEFAAPVKNPNTGAVRGTLLVLMKASVLEPALAALDPAQGGQVALVQTVAGKATRVLENGSGGGERIEVMLATPTWSLQYMPQAGAGETAAVIMVALVILVPLAVAALVVWLLLGAARKSLRQEVAVLIQWSQKAFGGERQKQPALQWDLLVPLSETLQRSSQSLEKRLQKVVESGAAKAAASPKTQPNAPSSAKAGADEPLFQDNDALDIDMLEGDDDILGLGSMPDDPGGVALEEVALPEVHVAPEIFRAYDIRGVVGETLTPDIVELIGRAIGSEAVSRALDTLCIGYDGRHSSPELASALARGILSTGCNVIEVGAVPTPVLYFATHHLETGSGVMVTGSHNPANYNGLKMVLGGETLSDAAIQKLLRRIQSGDFVVGQGERSQDDVRRAYLDRIVGDIAVAAPLKVVLDAGNGIAGELGPILVEELGCEVIPMYCDIDGSFPNHHPDPGKPSNLADLIRRVEAEGADIGLAFDGDGDRLGVVTNTGKIIWPDRLLMLFARDVVSRNPGADVLYDVKCSRRLANVINEAGGRPIMWKTGHSLMKAKMKETGALLAGEMSGHVFFQERWYGFDDGLYSAARLLEILGIEDRQSDEVFADFPEDVSTPELNIEVTESSKFELVDKLSREGAFGDGSISTIDGIRVDYPDGWGLCRASNTTPMLVLRFEAESDEALERIKAVFREQLLKVAPDLAVDF
ncbi:phosphomannomutase/phosphoglucomutase [Marinobacter zhejiangensis]|uniref:phosphomannomutase n=1 Tax=Marinobacter zhejiangensis TaxID=488535 RepID=A0A1I4L491_9GAMM|nr:phosphomannomutase/phosphoglucomutase [Marinobacter zhejiangensis]SFL85669.1 phosphomannomutase / phosphoglucomutase [Marinobacter zhejiangensis]